ncbi:MAG: hypothetical protein HYR85_23225, partial [Planctomycetes bacterium]|nr:hypothetical protein [Planctomycetota bacterium]
SKRGGRYFFTKNDGLQNQSVLYWAPSLDAEPKVLLNPNTLTADGTIALEGTAVSDDGKPLAYGLRSSGSDWIEWKVRDIDTATDLADDLKWIKFSGVTWSKKGEGLFYSRYDEPNAATMMEAANYYQKLFFHRVGTAQSEDVLVYQRPDQKEWGFMPRVTEDGRYLVIQVWKGTEDKYLYATALTRSSSDGFHPVVLWVRYSDDSGSTSIEGANFAVHPARKHGDEEGERRQNPARGRRTLSRKSLRVNEVGVG